MSFVGPSMPTAVSVSGSDTTWTNITNVLVDNTTSGATVTLTAGSMQTFSNHLFVSGYGFALGPGQEIQGVTVALETQVSTSSGSPGGDLYLTSGGSRIGGALPPGVTPWPTTTTEVDYAASVMPTLAQVNSADFGVELVTSIFSGTATFTVYTIKITIEYIDTPPQTAIFAGIATSFASGSPALQGKNTFVLSGVATAEVVGATPGFFLTWYIVPVGVSSGEGVGSPRLRPGGVIMSPAGAASGESLGTQRIAHVYKITLVGVPSEEQVGVPSFALFFLVDGDLVFDKTPFGAFLRVTSE